MMRPVLFLFMLILSVCGSAQHYEIRHLFVEAGKSLDGKKKFYSHAQSYDENEVVLKAYKGMAIAMYARVTSSIPEKLDCFHKGKALLEGAINTDIYNPEIRFLRYCMQAETPSILGYKGNLAEDLWRIIGGLKANMVNPKDQFWQMAINYLYNSKYADDNQKRELQPFLG
jgi:hypothetical protein